MQSTNPYQFPITGKRRLKLNSTPMWLLASSSQFHKVYQRVGASEWSYLQRKMVHLDVQWTYRHWIKQPFEKLITHQPPSTLSVPSQTKWRRPSSMLGMAIIVFHSHRNLAKQRLSSRNGAVIDTNEPLEWRLHQTLWRYNRWLPTDGQVHRRLSPIRHGHIHLILAYNIIHWAVCSKRYCVQKKNKEICVCQRQCLICWFRCHSNGIPTTATNYQSHPGIPYPSHCNRRSILVWIGSPSILRIFTSTRDVTFPWTSQ